MKIPFFRNRKPTIVYDLPTHRKKGNTIISSNSGLALTNYQLKQAVVLPKNENFNTWAAYHITDFYNKIDLLIETCLKHSCTSTTCPTMSAGPYVVYKWMDKTNKNYQQAQMVSAKEYIRLLMDWIKKQINDETIFPSDAKKPFPKNFQKIAQKIFSRMFRIFAHIYCSHLQDMKLQATDAHLNTIMIEKKELLPLNDVILQLLGQEYSSYLDLTLLKPAPEENRSSINIIAGSSAMSMLQLIDKNLRKSRKFGV